MGPPVPQPPSSELSLWVARLTHKVLAGAASVAIATVSRLKLHLFGARADVRRKLAKALGFEPHQLLAVPSGYESLAEARPFAEGQPFSEAQPISEA